MNSLIHSWCSVDVLAIFLAYIIVICENALPLILSVLWLRA